MRSYKSIERPAQVLGMDIQSLGLVFGLVIGGGMLLALVSMGTTVNPLVYLVLIVTAVGLFFTLRYLNKNRPPGFLMGYVSYHLRQPKRLTIGINHVQKQKGKAGRAK
ncbi:hypothetical protein [Hymenobacter mucosus]|jgi:hypothetical protein|uniref:PrgI family protein n=1 Tax=Hymenobacter mucosus TaxID=1411120 RepID=A0A239A2B9_9BACT|nr:hypothetical protein [Hymenobacter mucosus]SNR89258.1 hypothetical protein SAMN06269173_110121 [Hymenobacter mucosus]